MKVENFISTAVASLCAFLAGCGVGTNKNVAEFDWHATDSAPKHYPMEIRRGDFIYHDKSGSLYIPTGATLRSGWGEMVSRHVTGSDKKPLPGALEIYFFSYAENQFYHGEFDLPYDKILELFRGGVEERPERPIYNGIMVGVAPGGAVSVWVKGSRTTEVFFGQAEKVGIEPSAGFDLPFDSKSEADAFAKQVLIDTLSPEELKALKKNGIPFGAWARYRNLYKWVPAYKDGKIPSNKKIVTTYLNGEWNFMPTLLTEAMADTPRPLPRELKFSVVVGNEHLIYIINFEEFELMDAFEKLGSNGEKVYIEFDPQVPVERMKIRVYNEKESIELKKVHIE